MQKSWRLPKVLVASSPLSVSSSPPYYAPIQCPQTFYGCQPPPPISCLFFLAAQMGACSAYSLAFVLFAPPLPILDFDPLLI